MTTLVTEIEGFVNTRPLAHVSGDFYDEPPITPARLLGSVWKETCQLEKSYVTQREDVKKSDMCKQLKYLQEVREHL